MDQPEFPLAQAPQLRRGRGRPKGSTSKRSLDLARYIEATFAGQTPGQQMAALCMATPREVSQAKARALELGIRDAGLQPLVLALVVKAEQLARALSIDRAQAWSALHAERKELMAYVHQKQAPAADKGGARPIATVFMVTDGEAAPALGDFSDAEDERLEMVEVLSPAD